MELGTYGLGIYAGAEDLNRGNGTEGGNHERIVLTAWYYDGRRWYLLAAATPPEAAPAVALAAISEHGIDTRFLFVHGTVPDHLSRPGIRPLSRDEKSELEAALKSGYGGDTKPSPAEFLVNALRKLGVLQ
ncbi:hypothetical protein HYU15_03185 [Candidatus Woesearchaeota archaeon]|nr:hypothetical protein [Candidatus Woesearchaeota archaeon]